MPLSAVQVSAALVSQRVGSSVGLCASCAQEMIASEKSTTAGRSQVVTAPLLFVHTRSLFRSALKSQLPLRIVQPAYGTIYTGSTKKNAEHGGFSFGDTNVGLIVSNPAFKSSLLKTPVTTSQVAPTILRETGLSGEQYGFIISAFSIAYMVGNPVWGILLDRIG